MWWLQWASWEEYDIPVIFSNHLYFQRTPTEQVFVNICYRFYDIYIDTYGLGNRNNNAFFACRVKPQTTIAMQYSTIYP